MKIEAGKYYRLRNGVDVGPISRDSETDNYPWTANGKCWAQNGAYYCDKDAGFGEDERDIVAEILAPPNYSFSPMTHTMAVKPGETAGYAVDLALRVSETGAVKASIGKRPLHLLPRDAIEAVADVMAHGAARYGDRNWEKGLSVSDLVRAADGHLWDWYLRRDDGKDAGPNGSGLSHLAHAACSILFLLSHELRGLPDDRPAPVPAVPQPTRED